MRYLYWIFCLPYWGAAQSLEIRVSQCNPTEFIEIQIDTMLLDSATYQIFRKPEKGNWTLLRTQKNGIFQDTSKMVGTGEPFYYQVKADSFQSNVVGGYVCAKKKQITVIPYAPERARISSPDYFELSWSAVWGVPRYEIQIAQSMADFSLKTGFKTQFLDSILTDNIIRFNFPDNVNEVYWTVRCVTDTTKFYYANPIKFTRPKQGQFSSATPIASQLRMTPVRLRSNLLQYNLKNIGMMHLFNLQLHCYISESNQPQFTKHAARIPNAAVTIPQLMRLDSLPVSHKLDGTLFKDKIILIVPSIGGVFSSQVIGYKKL